MPRTCASGAYVRRQHITGSPRRLPDALLLTPYMDTCFGHLFSLRMKPPLSIQFANALLTESSGNTKSTQKKETTIQPHPVLDTFYCSSVLRHSIVQLRKHGDASLDPMFLSMLLSERQSDEHDEIRGVPGSAKRSLAHRCLVDRTHVRV